MDDVSLTNWLWIRSYEKPSSPPPMHIATKATAKVRVRVGVGVSVRVRASVSTRVRARANTSTRAKARARVCTPPKHKASRGWIRG